MSRLKTKTTSKSRADELLRLSAELRSARAQMLDQEAAAELVLGHIGITERLARTAAELRSAAP